MLVAVDVFVIEVYQGSYSSSVATYHVSGKSIRSAERKVQKLHPEAVTACFKHLELYARSEDLPIFERVK